MASTTSDQQMLAAGALSAIASLSLVPYLLLGAYGFKLAMTGETCAFDSNRNRLQEWGIAAIATLSAALMLCASGHKFSRLGFAGLIPPDPP